MEQNSRCFPKI